MLDCFINNEPFGYTYTYKTGVYTATNKDDARIKVKNAQVDILLIAGEKDNIGNAYDGCVEIMNILAKHKYKYNYSLLAYENAGHLSLYPYIIPVAVTASMKLAPRLVFTTGGTLEGNSHIQKNSSDKTIEFFRKG
jgi:hypothetical protein